jgi:hypothetical protein
MNKKILVIGLLLNSIAFGQKNVVATGGEASGSGGTSSFTVGQIDYTYQTGTSGSMNFGVQQPFEIFTNELAENPFDISVDLFPNPAVDFVVMTIANQSSFGAMSYNLTDEQGRLVRSEKIASEQVQVSVSDLPNACYYLNVIIGDQLAKSFKLVKSN